MPPNSNVTLTSLLPTKNIEFPTVSCEEIDTKRMSFDRQAFM
jgi:hypothetical protein